MESALEQLGGQVSLPTYDEAKVHLHNLAHTFMSPLVLLGALQVVEEKTAAYGELADKVDTLQRQHDKLLQDCTDLEEMQKGLQQSVTGLERRRDALNAELGRIASTFIAQVQNVPVQDDPHGE